MKGKTLIHYSRITYSLSLSHLKSTITNLSSPPRISYRRCKNLLDILVRAKHRRQAPPASGAFCHRNKCKTCPFIREGTTSYTFFSTKEQRGIRHHITCSSSNLVYMIQCNKCNAQCIGETKLNVISASDLMNTDGQSKEPSQSNPLINQPPFPITSLFLSIPWTT